MLGCLLGWCSGAHAQYVIVLKNGREITAQSYREEGAKIRFFGSGGEMAIGRDQVQAIRRAGEGERVPVPAFVPEKPAPDAAPAPSAGAKARETAPSGTPPAAGQQSPDPSEEERAYQRKIKELTEQLRGLRERYALLTRGNTGSEPKLFTTEEAFRGHQEDLLSRLRDAQYKAQGLPAGSNATSPPFSLDAPPGYTEKQKELSDLRRRMSEVEERRQKLIEEMKSKNYDTGSLFLD